MPHLPAAEALSHITVLDMTPAGARPTPTRQLADWGANFILAEFGLTPKEIQKLRAEAVV